MNRNIMIILAMTFCLSIMAEDYIQVVPFETAAGVTYEDCTPFSMNMVNTNSYTAMEFHLILPEGMTLDMSYPFDMSADRFPGVTRRGVFYPNHDYNITNPSAGDYYIKIYNTNNEKIDGTEGELLSFYFAVASDMKPGYYTIKVSGAILGIDSHTGIYPEKSVSWVKVGDPGANALLDLGSYAIPSFVAAKMPEQNVIIDGVCSNFVLTDGADVNIASGFTAKQATFSRTLTGDYGTICLPYAPSTDDHDFYELAASSETKLFFNTVTSPKANTPYMYSKKGSSDDIVSFNVAVSAGSAVSAEVGEWKMVGTYQQTVLTDNVYFLGDQNRIYRNTGNLTIPPFRAYFKHSTGAPSKVSAYIDSNPTSLEMLENGDVVEGTRYNVYGQPVDENYKGLVIIDGKIYNNK